MKRSAATLDRPRAKVAKTLPHYHLTPSKRTSAGDIIWPAPSDQLDNARRIIRQCAADKRKTVICPDKDADGLSSGVILWRTLRFLGLPQDLLHVYLLSKHETVHSEHSRGELDALDPTYLFILDHGSRPSEPILTNPDSHTFIIDHHQASSTDFPEGAQHVTACDSPPVATSALLTYEICKPLHDDVETECAWLCALGTQGDLGNTIKWEHPFPDMSAAFKRHTKKRIADAVSLINGPRRTATYDVQSAWDALLAAAEATDDSAGPASILKNERLLDARAEVNAESERCAHTPPRFSGDATVAVLRITSPAQVHPLVATRWAQHLSGPRLRFVMCANDGWRPGWVNFSCRVAKAARVRDTDDGDGYGGVNIIESLKEWASKHESGTLIERMGESFARGHVQASGGIVKAEEFEELMQAMEVGARKKMDDSPKKKVKTVEKSPQKNTLANYFGKKAG